MSTPVDPPLWTPAQQSWLQAMGYTVFVDGSVDEAVADTGIALGMAEAETPAPRQPPMRERAAEHVPHRAAAPAETPTPRRTAPTRIDEPAPAAAQLERAAGSRRPAVRMPDRLQIALLRASGRNPAEAETQALMAGWNLDELRANPAAKRALWPQLRALRKRSRG